MKKIFLIIGVFCTLLFSACQKDNTTNNNNSTNNPTDYYITFDLAGTPIEYRSVGYQCNTSNGSTSGGIVQFKSGGPESIYIDINMDTVTQITESDLHSIIGQKLDFCFSSSLTKFLSIP